MHYSTTVPFYKTVNEEFAKATEAAGQEKSIMPLRYMHQLSAVGCGKTIDFNEADKTISMGFLVVDPDAINKVKKGVLTGFSHGGEYVRKWTQGGTNYYTAAPGEVSLVDSPALKEARFEYIKADGSMEMRHFTENPTNIKMSTCEKCGCAYPEGTEHKCASDATPDPSQMQRGTGFSEADAQKLADALIKSLELKKDAKTKRKAGKDLHASDFAYVGDPEDTSTWKLPIHDAAHVRNALARFNQTQGIPDGEKSKVKAKIKARAKHFGIEAADEAAKLANAVEYLKCRQSGEPMSKNLYDVGQMAQVLETIRWLHSSALWEREYEGDASTQPEDLEALLQDAIQAFMSMAEEEASELAELAAAASREKGAKAMTNEELQKRTASVMDHLNKAKAAASAHHTAMHGHLDKCMKALSGDGAIGGAGGDPSNMDPAAGAGGGDGRHSSPAGLAEVGGTAAQTNAKASFVLIGKTSDGVEIYKKVEEPAAKAEVTVEKIGEMINDSIATFFKGFFGEDGKTTTAPGVGDRTAVVTKTPAATEPVTKGADATKNPGAGATQTVEITPDIIIKANQGDPAARLTLARSIKPMDPNTQHRVEQSIGLTRTHR